MGIRRNRRIDRATAEQLLTGDPAVDSALGRLLSEAGAPASREEVAGEDAATAMWRAAGRQPIAPAAPGRRWRVRVATVKIVTVGVALGVGGVALAATTGVLTGPPPPTRPTAAHTRTDATDRSDTSPAVRPTPGSGAPGDGSVGATGPASTSSGDPRPTATPAQLAGLCHAYAAAMKAGHTDALDRPAYAPLISAAGGRDRVAAFCAALASAAPKPGHGQPTPAPQPDGTSTGNPGKGHGNGTATDHPTHPSH